MKKYILIDTKNINDNKYNFRYNLPNTIHIKEYVKLNMMLLPRMSLFMKVIINLILHFMVTMVYLLYQLLCRCKITPLYLYVIPLIL